MKRILYLNHSGRIAGAERCLIRILDDLDRSRFEPIVVCPEGDLAAAARSRDVPTLTMNFVDYQKNHSRMGAGSVINPFLVLYHCLWLLFMGVQLAGVVRRFNASLVHANTLLSRLPGWLAGRLARVPVIWHVRDILQNQLWVRMYDRIARLGVTRIVTVSNACHDQFSDRSKIVTVYDGISLERFQPDQQTRSAERSKLGWTESELVFGIFGRITPWKGLLDFAEAAAIVHRKYPLTRFLVVGQAWSPEDKEFESNVRAFLVRERLQDCFVFTGFREDVPQLMVACDVVVVPSVAPDPFPNTVLEGMSCSRAVLAFPVGGIPEAIVDGVSGRLVPQMDAAGLAQGMEDLIDNSVLRAEMGTNGRNRVVERFDTLKTQRAIESTYEELLCACRFQGSD